MQNTNKQSGPKQPPRRILKSQGEPSSSDPKEKKDDSGKKDYSALKSSPSFKEAQCALGPRPNTEERPVRGLLATRGSISASPEGRRPTLGEPTDYASFEAPSIEPLAGPRFGGKLRLGRDYPSIDGDCNPPAQQTRTFNANHSTVGRGSQTASVTMPHSGHDRSPVRQLQSLCHHSPRRVDSPCTART